MSCLLQFCLCVCVCFYQRLVVSIRDMLSWVNFVNVYCKQQEAHGLSVDRTTSAAEAYVNGACLVLLDSLGSGQAGLSNVTTNTDSSISFRESCLSFLVNQVREGLSRSKFVSSATGGTASSTFVTGPFCGYPPFLVPQG